MKYRIIGSVLVVFILVVLYVMFASSAPQDNPDGGEPTTSETQSQ